MQVSDKDFARLLSVAEDRCNDLAERADHGESDLDDEVADLTKFIQKYDPEYVNPYDNDDDEDEDEDEDDEEENDEDEDE